MIRHDYFEHLDGPQGRVDVSGRRMPGMGGGGGGSPAYYKNMDKLYGVQAQAAQFMLDNSMPYIPGAMQNSYNMTQEAMDGTLAKRMRDQAGADASQALGTGLAAANRNMERYGAEFNPNRVQQQNTSAALNGAAVRANAMNAAGQWAEDQKWNRNAGMFGQLTGMSNGAMSGLSSAASGYGQMANMQNMNSMANAQGMGQFGAAMSYGMMKKDGGYINEPGLAMGGDPWLAYKNQNPIQASAPQQQGGSGLGMVLAGAAPMLAGKGLKMAMNSAPVQDAWNSAKSSLVDSFYGATPAHGPEAVGLTQAGPSAELSNLAGVNTFAAPETAAATEALSATAPEVATAAGADAASGALLTNPATAALGVGLMLAPLLEDAFASGGPIQGRKDMRPGGHVQGPGTETSDSIPAWLSKGEYVLNAEAVKQVGKDKLDAANKRGLKARNQKSKGKPEGKGLKLAKGGAVKKGC